VSQRPFAVNRASKPVNDAAKPGGRRAYGRLARAEANASAAPDAADPAEGKTNRCALPKADDLGVEAARNSFDFNTSADFKRADPIFDDHGKIGDAIDSAASRNRRAPSQRFTDGVRGRSPASMYRHLVPFPARRRALLFAERTLTRLRLSSRKLVNQPKARKVGGD
jgi:hypothetical protein